MNNELLKKLIENLLTFDKNNLVLFLNLFTYDMLKTPIEKRPKEYAKYTKGFRIKHIPESTVRTVYINEITKHKSFRLAEHLVYVLKKCLFDEIDSNSVCESIVQGEGIDNEIFIDLTKKILKEIPSSLKSCSTIYNLLGLNLDSEKLKIIENEILKKEIEAEIVSQSISQIESSFNNKIDNIFKRIFELENKVNIDQSSTTNLDFEKNELKLMCSEANSQVHTALKQIEQIQFELSEIAKGNSFSNKTNDEYLKLVEDKIKDFNAKSRSFEEQRCFQIQQISSIKESENASKPVYLENMAQIDFQNFNLNTPDYKSPTDLIKSISENLKFFGYKSTDDIASIIVALLLSDIWPFYFDNNTRRIALASSLSCSSSVPKLLEFSNSVVPYKQVNDVIQNDLQSTIVIEDVILKPFELSILPVLRTLSFNNEFNFLLKPINTYYPKIILNEESLMGVEYFPTELWKVSVPILTRFFDLSLSVRSEKTINIGSISHDLLKTWFIKPVGLEVILKDLFEDLSKIDYRFSSIAKGPFVKVYCQLRNFGILDQKAIELLLEVQLLGLSLLWHCQGKVLELIRKNNYVSTEFIERIGGVFNEDK